MMGPVVRIRQRAPFSFPDILFDTKRRMIMVQYCFAHRRSPCQASRMSSPSSKERSAMRETMVRVMSEAAVPSGVFVRVIM